MATGTGSRDQAPGQTRPVFAAMLPPSELVAVVDEVLRGDREAFRTILRAYGLSLRGYIATQVHHMDDADDLAQEVFFVAYRNLVDFRRGEDFGAWLRGIARNKVYNHLRSTNRRHRAMQRFREEVARAVEADLEGAVAGDHSGVVEMLLRCIAALPERMRRVVRAGLDGD